MAQPTNPEPTDTAQHAPGISRTLEKGAAKSRDEQEKRRAETDQADEAKERPLKE